MNLSEWRKLPRMENEDSFHTKLKVGQKFLYGLRQIGQIEKKKVGQEINFYTVLRIENKGCEYVLTFEMLEKYRKSGKKFDVCVIQNVLEHVLEPRTLLFNLR